MLEGRSVLHSRLPPLSPNCFSERIYVDCKYTRPRSVDENSRSSVCYRSIKLSFSHEKKHSDAYCRTLETGSLIFSEIILIANVN